MTRLQQIVSAGAMPALVCLLAAAPARAQDAQVRALVQTSQNDLDGLIARTPRVAVVADAISADCARALPDDAKTPGFCRCSAAVTFTMWLSGVDGGDVRGTLNAYLRNPTPTTLANLMLRQDPSIYKSACEKALGKS